VRRPRQPCATRSTGADSHVGTRYAGRRGRDERGCGRGRPNCRAVDAVDEIEEQFGEAPRIVAMREVSGVGEDDYPAVRDQFVR